MPLLDPSAAPHARAGRGFVQAAATSVPVARRQGRADGRSGDRVTGDRRPPRQGRPCSGNLSVLLGNAGPARGGGRAEDQSQSRWRTTPPAHRGGARKQWRREVEAAGHAPAHRGHATAASSRAWRPAPPRPRTDRTAPLPAPGMPAPPVPGSPARQRTPPGARGAHARRGRGPCAGDRSPSPSGRPRAEGTRRTLLRKRPPARNTVHGERGRARRAPRALGGGAISGSTISTPNRKPPRPGRRMPAGSGGPCAPGRALAQGPS